MRHTTILLVGAALIAVAAAGYLFFPGGAPKSAAPKNVDPTPRAATLSGTYGCLPHANTSGPQTMECAFGLKTDDGAYYAVNFGQSADAMQQFQSGAHVTAEGFVVSKQALNTNQWQKYNMEGIFTITKVLEAK